MANLAEFGASGRAGKQMGTLMITPISHRRPFFDKLQTSTLKRRVRLARWVARMRGRNMAPVACRYFGADFIVMPGDVITEEIAIKRYEWWELTMMLKTCQHCMPDVFIDVGANIGLYSCVLGRAGAARKLLAFEPDGKNFARLSENLVRNGLSGVTTARPVAVGAVPRRSYRELQKIPDYQSSVMTAL